MVICKNVPNAIYEARAQYMQKRLMRMDDNKKVYKYLRVSRKLTISDRYAKRILYDAYNEIDEIPMNISTTFYVNDKIPHIRVYDSDNKLIKIITVVRNRGVYETFTADINKLGRLMCAFRGQRSLPPLY